ncbi:MAG: acetate--CoA ligase family protein [Candidatus Bathyarchaeia archaeon]|jgi:acyl-CoA synthetase (NDP forming)
MRDPKIDEIFKVAKDEDRNFLYEHEAKALFALYDLPVTQIQVAPTEDEAVEAANRIGYPIVLKIVSPQILHKSDAGGVIVGVEDDQGIRDGFKKIVKNAKAYNADAEITGILVQEMAPNGTEIIVGSTTDPTFGPTLMFGLGGIFVEILKDVSFRVAPITERDAAEMIEEIKAVKILDGARGMPPCHKPTLAEILHKTSKMLMENPEIKELDMNPILAYPDSAMIVDARIIM